MERITRRKMADQLLDRKVKRLRSWFRYRGDYLPYSTSLNTTVKRCLDEMEYMQQATGYYLIWEITWEMRINDLNSPHIRRTHRQAASHRRTTRLHSRQGRGIGQR